MFKTGPIKSNHVIYYVVPETIDKTSSSPKLVLDNKVSFFYVVQQGAVTGATECLAFSNGATGVIRTVFFKYLLPDNKFVITDFDYTKEGHRWFEAQYFYAFTHPERYDVYSINMQTKEVNQVDRIQFLGMQESWRGVGRGHLRFAIALKNVPVTV